MFGEISGEPLPVRLGSGVCARRALGPQGIRRQAASLKLAHGDSRCGEEACCLLPRLPSPSAAGYRYFRFKKAAPASQEWEQLTDFPDAAVAPALSPDGKMLAFVRGYHTFLASGDVYVKLLPRGEPVQLTHQDKLKAEPAFSPDGSRIAYTTDPPWDTWVVPVLGGPTRLMLPNASGLTWIDNQHVLFSEIKSGIHMAVVTATEGRAEQRDVYVPQQEAGMAHRSSLSPDHKWVLIAEEMTAGTAVVTTPCRVVPFDGSSPGRLVGPQSACSYGGWSPDGKWMLFSAHAGGGFHLFRQAFPERRARATHFWTHGTGRRRSCAGWTVSADFSRFSTEDRLGARSIGRPPSCFQWVGSPADGSTKLTSRILAGWK